MPVYTSMVPIVNRQAVRGILAVITTVIVHATAFAASDEAANAGWFASQRLPELIGIGLFLIAIGIAAFLANRGFPITLRPLPPLAAVENAIGRATEQGTPVVYVTGWGGDMARPTTMASMVVLSQVARQAAEYNCRLLFPSHDPLIVSVAQETVMQAARAAGHPDWYRRDDLSFVSQSQLGYSAAVDGIMVRERPGAVFLLGTFEGEALILAETANRTGAVTIAGTDSTIQLSFLLVACDYTLIGEELFAASGIVSGDRRILSAILGQDWLRYLIITIILTGAAMVAFGGTNISQWLVN